jgi:hypothetical protein
MKFRPNFIEKLYEITTFIVRFYIEETASESSLMDLEDRVEVQDKVERLLLLNINQNFSLLKSDFTAPLQLVHNYLKSTPVLDSEGPLVQVGLYLIS